MPPMVSMVSAIIFRLDAIVFRDFLNDAQQRLLARLDERLGTQDVCCQRVVALGERGVESLGGLIYVLVLWCPNWPWGANS